MLQFLRRHQHYFFFVITVVIIISFSFFGTYTTLEGPSYGDRVVSTAVDGQQIRHADVEQMALFIGSDGVDKLAWGGQWGPNFLNDGVIAKDFLTSGLAEKLVAAYAPDLSQELNQRLEREKRYSFYTHPTAPFISAEVIWGYFTPQVPAAMARLKAAGDASQPDAFQARSELFLAERAFPAHSLRQVLRHQEKQYQWVTPDPNLDRTDLSLYGYHTTEDWFGQRFVRLVSQFIINASKIAESKGYVVTRDEAIADLVYHAQESYKQLTAYGLTPAASPEQYLKVQLQKMGLDENTAAALWRRVLLFRRLFDGVGQAIFVDPLPFSQFNQYAQQQISGTRYQLDDSLRLPDFRALQKFQIYLAAVAGASPTDALGLPNQFESAETLLKKQPELVQKRYLVQLAQVNAKALQGRVPVKEMWAWQTQEEHWQLLKREFPELGISGATTEQERLAALDGLNPTTRNRVEAFSRAAVVKDHPEWVAEALATPDMDTQTISLRLKGGHSPFVGVENPQTLIDLLDNAPIGSIPPSLQNYTADGLNFYRVKVLDRSRGWEVLSFGEATSDGTLEALLLAKLEPYYLRVRESQPERFRKSDGSWRSMTEVRDLVAELYFKDLLDAIEKDYRTGLISGEEATALTRNGAAAHRLRRHLQNAQEVLKNDPSQEAQWIKATEKEGAIDRLSPPAAVVDQFKLVKRVHGITRGEALSARDRQLLFALKEGHWSPVIVQPTGELWFFNAETAQVPDVIAATADQIAVARNALAVGAQQLLMTQVLNEIREKGAIVLTDQRMESIDAEAQQ